MKEKRKNTPVVIYMTETEKETLQNEAKKNGHISLSAYLKDKILPDTESEALAAAGVIEVDGILDGETERTRQVKSVLSDDEYEFVKRAAGNMSISAFIRKTLLTSGNGKYTFEVKTDDLSEITSQLSEFNMRLNGIIAAWQYRTELFKSDATNISRMVDEVNENIKDITTKTIRDRNYIKKKGLIYLQEQIDKVASNR